jgi:hypothetical protein
LVCDKHNDNQKNDNNHYYCYDNYSSDSQCSGLADEGCRSAGEISRILRIMLGLHREFGDRVTQLHQNEENGAVVRAEFGGLYQQEHEE